MIGHYLECYLRRSFLSRQYRQYKMPKIVDGDSRRVLSRFTSGAPRGTPRSFPSAFSVASNARVGGGPPNRATRTESVRLIDLLLVHAGMNNSNLLSVISGEERFHEDGVKPARYAFSPWTLLEGNPCLGFPSLGFLAAILTRSIEP